MYTPSFRNATPTDPPTNPDRNAITMWVAMHNLSRAPYYGPHARPSDPEARRTNLLPGCPPGLYAVTGDLATLAPGSLIVCASDAGPRQLVGSGNLYWEDPSHAEAPLPYSRMPSHIGPLADIGFRAGIAHRRTEAAVGSFQILNLHWIPAVATPAMDFVPPPLRHPINGPTFVLLSVTAGITTCLADPSTAGHQDAITSRLNAFDLCLINLAEHMEHTRALHAPRHAPLPLFSDLTVPLPMETQPGPEHICHDAFDITEHMRRCIQNRLARRHVC